MKTFKIFVVLVSLLCLQGCVSHTIDSYKSPFEVNSTTINIVHPQFYHQGFVFPDLIPEAFSLKSLDDYGWITWVETKVDGKIQLWASSYLFCRADDNYNKVFKNKYDVSLVFQTSPDSKKGSLQFIHIAHPPFPTNYKLTCINRLNPPPWTEIKLSHTSKRLQYPIKCDTYRPICIRKWHSLNAKKGQWEISMWCMFVPNSTFKSVYGTGYFSDYSWDFIDPDTANIIEQSMQD